MSEEIYQELSEGLDKSIEAGYLPNPGAKVGINNHNDSDSTGYIRSLCSRLIDLGYMDDNDKNRSLTKTNEIFSTAVKAFQKDVGLTSLKKDGWAGPKTWQILQCLVSFEDEQEPKHWPRVLKSRLETNPAVARAVYLRLWVMGFFVLRHDRKVIRKLKKSDKLSIKNKHFNSALTKFWLFAKDIGLVSQNTANPTKLTRNVLNILFNHDGIIRALAQKKSPLFIKYGVQIAAIARIELWLQGYDCQPKPYVGIRKVGHKKTTIVKQKDLKLEHAIKSFWQDHAQPLKPNSHFSKKAVSQDLFKGLSGLIDSPDLVITDTTEIAKKVGSLLSKEENSQETFIETFKNLASSIYDGTKRILKSIWHTIKNVISSTTNLLRNMARYIAREARRFYHLVTRAVDVVQAGADYLSHSIYPSSLPSPVIIGRGADFDHYLFIDKSADKLTKSDAFTSYIQFSKYYQAGCVIVGELVSILSQVVKLAVAGLSGPIGWLRVLIALGGFRSSLEHVQDALSLLDSYKIQSGSGGVMLVDIA